MQDEEYQVSLSKIVEMELIENDGGNKILQRRREVLVVIVVLDGIDEDIRVGHDDAAACPVHRAEPIFQDIPPSHPGTRLITHDAEGL